MNKTAAILASSERFNALFSPEGIAVIGVNSHPAKFGFVAAHNILRHDYCGRVFLVKRDSGELLGEKCLESVDDIPDGAVDLAFICTPAAANPDILRSCAAKGVKAAFVVSAGYGEAGPEGREAQAELVKLCEELGILLAGPNGQGLVSPPVGLCAQIVAPMPLPGNIGVVSQSGNLVSSFMNLVEGTGIGISRGISAGNCAALGVADYLEYFAQDPETAVSLAYLEGLPDGRTFFDRAKKASRVQPLVLLKGGVTSGGAKAAASHTGSLASNDRIFHGMCRQAGISRVADVEEAVDTASAFSVLPLPRGRNVFVLTTAGGWGVLTADRISRSRDLSLMDIPPDIMAGFDAKLPSRWSRSNPADLAGGETRDTLPECLELVVAHPEVHAVVLLGLGIQSNQAHLAREGKFYPDNGLERICKYHERQDMRYADAVVDLMSAYDKPVLVATELAAVQPDNPGPARLRACGVPCFSTSHRAVTALEHLARYAKYRETRGI